MEVAMLDKKNFIKIKGKHTSFIVGSSAYDGPKTNADAFLVFKRHAAFDTSRIEGLRIVIQAQGEYEIGGIKITTTGSLDSLAHVAKIDGLNVCILPSEQIGVFSEKLGECHVLVVYINSQLEEAKLAAYAPKAVVLYGEHESKDIILGLSTEEILPVAKFQTTVDKLPDEMQVVRL